MAYQTFDFNAYGGSGYGQKDLEAYQQQQGIAAAGNQGMYSLAIMAGRQGVPIGLGMQDQLRAAQPYVSDQDLSKLGFTYVGDYTQQTNKGTKKTKQWAWTGMPTSTKQAAPAPAPAPAPPPPPKPPAPTTLPTTTPPEPQGPTMEDMATQFSTQIQDMQKSYEESLKQQAAQFQQMQTAQQERMADLQQQMLQSQIQQQQRPTVAGVRIGTSGMDDTARLGTTGTFSRRGMRISSINI